MFTYEIVIDHSETSNKCTVLPQFGRPDFKFYQLKKIKSMTALSAPLLLHHEGQSILNFKNTVKQIACIDCTWRRLDPILKKIPTPLPVFVKIPSEFKTAYPRANAKGEDPPTGLATIEALFTARALLGHWDPTLLQKYAFCVKFLELNKTLFASLGVQEINLPQFWPVFLPAPRNALARKKAKMRANRF